ncbi:ras-related GTP-binding protein D-like isoform X2 [Pseudoliparis swirei]|uniref:ras-related GTP-binding protein D-like isoform X2 n=1 Tax=Pseudoliparis swirei TaxID=2059687 RepID=UPI0024BEF787|nr:ras-related GTP-binding protein D-like isoform X2 [Pseudoliparis swirei]
MSPNETLFLESTNKICREDVSSSSFVSFQIWDFPGQIDFFDPTFDYEMIFRGTGALIFVIDSQTSSSCWWLKKRFLLSSRSGAPVWTRCIQSPR